MGTLLTGVGQDGVIALGDAWKHDGGGVWANEQRNRALLLFVWRAYSLGYVTRRKSRGKERSKRKR